jgi:hypothetical protein
VVSWGTKAREINGSEPEYCGCKSPIYEIELARKLDSKQKWSKF